MWFRPVRRLARPDRLPAEPVDVPPRPVAKDRAEVEASLRALMGGEEKVYRPPAESPVLVNAVALAGHLDPARSASTTASLTAAMTASANGSPSSRSVTALDSRSCITIACIPASSRRATSPHQTFPNRSLVMVV
jgi:hypothetical protein